MLTMFASFIGMVPESKSEVAKARQYQEGPRTTGTQRPPPDVFGRTHPSGGNYETRTAAKREKANATGKVFLWKLLRGCRAF